MLIFIKIFTIKVNNFAKTLLIDQDTFIICLAID